MLYVYTYPVPKPQGALDVSTIPLAELVEACKAIHAHQRKGVVWFGYLDGWMLQPHEEVLLRPLLRSLECHVVSFFPLAFSQAWKNEIQTIYTSQEHGDSDSDDDGGLVQHGRDAQHRHFGPSPSIE